MVHGWDCHNLIAGRGRYREEGDHPVDICIIGSETDTRVQALRGYATGKQATPLVVPEATIAANGISQETKGVVVFDNQQRDMATMLIALRKGARFMSVPVIVVGSESESRSRLFAAGASVVCDGVTPEKIWEAIIASQPPESVSTDYQAQVLGPFIEATRVTLQEMAGIPAEIACVYQRPRHRMFGDFSAVIGLTTGAEGAVIFSLIFSFEEPTARELGRRILQGVDEQPSDEMIRDCIGEIANVVAGQARGLLFNTDYQFHMSTPTVVCGSGHEIRQRPGVPCVVAVLKTPIGQFALQLCLSSNDQKPGEKG
jgi:chemotaxis protein CheX